MEARDGLFLALVGQVEGQQRGRVAHGPSIFAWPGDGHRLRAEAGPRNGDGEACCQQVAGCQRVVGLCGRRLGRSGDARGIGASLSGVAGLYQFAPLKYDCLDTCRSPVSFLMTHWQGRHDRYQALRLGVCHGLFCLGCCWSLMLLMFAVGMGNLGWMLLLGAIMAIEKNLPWGRHLSAPLGVVLLCGSLAVVLEALLVSS